MSTDPSDAWTEESVPSGTVSSRTAPSGTAPPNPYDELGTLADNPLDEFLHEDDPEAGLDDQPWSRPNHRRGSRRRNRFAGLPLATKAVVGILVLAAFLTLADRWALLYAEHRAADRLKDQLHLSAAPEVDIEGFPFLTQLADRRLDEVKVTVPDVAASRVSSPRSPRPSAT